MQNLNDRTQIVNADGTPTAYFMRLLQDRGILQGDAQDQLAQLLARNITTSTPGLTIANGSLANPGDITVDAAISALIDNITGATVKGAILYRDTALWKALAPGAATYLFQANGAGAIPSWVPPPSGGAGSGPTNLGAMRPLTDFTAVNISGTRSLIEVAGKAITAQDTSPGGSIRVFGMSRAVPATPYRVAMFLQDDNPNFNYGGISFGWTDGTKFDHCMNGADNTWYNEQLSNPTTRAGISALSARRYTPSAGGIWVGCYDDGTNVWFQVSATGVYWSNLVKKTKAAGYLGGAGYSNIFVGQWEESSPTGTDFPMASTIRQYDEAGLTRTF